MAHRYVAHLDPVTETFIELTGRLNYPMLIVTTAVELLYFHDVKDIEPGHSA